MQIGKRVRLSRWFSRGKTFVLVIDQGIPRGLAPQIRNNMATWCNADNPWKAVFVHQGQVMAHEDLFASEKGLPFIIKLTSNSKDCPNTTVRSMISSVKRAVAFGASGVAINMFVGSDFEANHLSQFGQVVDDCEKYGMPLVVLANPAKKEDNFIAEKLAYACMIASEMGADIVKSEHPGTIEGHRMMVEACLCPLVVEESCLSFDDAGTIKTVENAMAAGAAGAFLGDRLWKSNDPLALARKVKEIIW